MEKAAYINSVSTIFLIFPLPMRIWRTILEKLVEILQGFVPLSLDKMVSKRDIMGWTKTKPNTLECRVSKGSRMWAV